MGDGRYYTFYQFFDVLLIMISVIFSLFSIVHFYYKKNNKASIDYIFYPLYSVTIFGVLRIIEYVYPNMEVCIKLRNLSTIILIATIVTSRLSRFKIKKYFYMILIGLVTVLLIRHNIFISDFEYHNIVYSSYYKALVVIVMVHSLVISYKVSIGKDSKILLLPDLMFFLIPVLAYGLIVFLNKHFVDYFETTLMILLTVFINIKFFKADESSYTTIAFDKIGNMGLSYIYVIDDAYKVIYKNNMVKSSHLFQSVVSLDLDDFSKLFGSETLVKYTYKDKEYFELTIEKKYYFSYGMTELHEEDKCIGYIVTFADVTELLDLLIHLEEKKHETKKVNERLKNYSQVVYHLEKEKEINKLLEEIVTSRDRQMTYLSQLVQDATSKLEDDLFEKYIEVAINKSNEILEDVRETVTKYREYYGG